jgi:hypothetical protein
MKWSCRSRNFQQTANSVLTVCLSQGDNRRKRYGAAFADQTIEDYMTGAIRLSILHQGSGGLPSHSYESSGSIRFYTPCSRFGNLCGQMSDFDSFIRLLE